MLIFHADVHKDALLRERCEAIKDEQPLGLLFAPRLFQASALFCVEIEIGGMHDGDASCRDEHHH